MQGRNRFVASIVLTAALGVLLALFGLAAVIANLTAGGRSWGGAIVELGILAVGVLLVVHATRRDRQRRHGLYSQAAPGITSRRVRRRPAVHSPILPAIFTLALTGIAIASVVNAVQLHGQSGTSAYTQSSGLRRYALVFTVKNIEHQDRTSTWYTAEITAVLAQPVAGHVATTIYVPYGVSVKTGQLVQVLVDPKQPEHSEFPGARYITTTDWLTPVAVTVVLLGLAALFGWGTFLTFRVWRRWRALTRGTIPGGAELPGGADSAVPG
jgi:hypothetical protein